MTSLILRSLRNPPILFSVRFLTLRTETVIFILFKQFDYKLASQTLSSGL
jgi:hypothetical protein